ncbi:unnamed protein product [Penicillium glandicola]
MVPLFWTSRHLDLYTQDNDDMHQAQNNKDTREWADFGYGTVILLPPPPSHPDSTSFTDSTGFYSLSVSCRRIRAYGIIATSCAPLVKLFGLYHILEYEGSAF